MKQEFTITAYTENHIGMINRIAIIFSRRKVNIDSINAGPTEVAGIYRFTIVLTHTEEMVEKITLQIAKQVEVLRAFYNSDDELVWQEMAMYKVPTKVIAEQVKVERLLRQYGANTVVIRNDYTVFETTGHREEIDALANALEPWGLIEFVRSARIAIIKASDGLHKTLLEFEEKHPSKPHFNDEKIGKPNKEFTL